jgi:hypothetical protein
MNCEFRISSPMPHTLSASIEERAGVRSRGFQFAIRHSHFVIPLPAASEFPS